jgi:putative PIN family toxin of toxin-antitoxin system
MKQNNCFVLDTNALISAALISTSVNARALDAALENGRFALSEPALQEFIDVIFRKKFDKYFLNDAERFEAIDKIERNAVFFLPKEIITSCRDTKDNKFLELAVAASASCIITGDKDLLVLHPFRNIPILSAAEFLATFSM